MVDVRLLGTAGKVPLPHRRLSSCVLRVNGSVILLDCGEGTQVGFRECSIAEKQVDVICLTHYHADHILGLAGMFYAIANTGRTAPITIIGPAGLNRILTAMRVFAPELPFDIKAITLSEDTETIDFGEYSITAFKVDHGIPCYGYTLNVTRRAKFNVERAKAEDIPQEYWTQLTEGVTCFHDGRIFTPDMVLDGPRKGIKVTYCTDSRPCNSIVAAAESADLLILEGMYCDPAQLPKARETGHMLFSEAAKIAAKANARELWLTHYCQTIVRPANHVESIKSIFSNVRAGYDGLGAQLVYDN